MLQITDLSLTKHMINLSNLNNVVIRQQSDAHVISFHMRDHHVLPITVDQVTAERIQSELLNLGANL